MAILKHELHFTRLAKPHSAGLEHGIRGHPSFCTVCTSFDWEVASAQFQLQEGLFLEHNRDAVMVTATMRDIAEAAREGCCSCLLIETVVRTLTPDHFDSQSERELYITYRANTALLIELEVNPDLATDLESSGYVAVELFTLPGKPCPWNTIGSEITALNPQYHTWPVPGGQAAAISSNSSDDICFDRIKSWIKCCETDHPYCDPSFELPTRQKGIPLVPPKRLIYVGDSDDEVCLRDTDGKHSRYVALSYCWGSSVGTTLLRANVEELYIQMHYSTLLKTHQDAIKITRNLGLKYLWVDALCIIQDSPADKADEIKNMASIYTGAYVSIAATASYDSAAGCFRERAPSLQISLVEMEGQHSDVFARLRLDHVAFDWNNPNAFEPSARNLLQPNQATISRYPIFTRGWTFQERLLSPRIIHYTSEEIVWECLGASFCECGTLDHFVGSRALRERRYAAGVPYNVEVLCGKVERGQRMAKRLKLLNFGYDPRNLTSVLSNDHAFMTAMLGHPPEDRQEDAEMQERWRDLVSQYSTRNLTYSSDALPALSGLATSWTYSQQRPANYLAGIWEDDLLRSVLWKCIDRKPNHRPADYLAPTWSWASIRRTVDWVPATRSCHYHVNIVDAMCSTSGSNRFGQVIGGRLTVTGPVLQAQLETNSHTCFAKAGGKAASFVADSVPEIRGIGSSTVYCLLWNTDINDKNTNMGFYRAIVLRASKPHGAKPEVFTRIGLMEHFLYDEWHGLARESTITII